MQLFNGTGQFITSDDDGGGNLNARIAFRAPSSGTYVVFATTLAAGLLGQFELTVAEAAGGPATPPAFIARSVTSTAACSDASRLCNT